MLITFLGFVTGALVGLTGTGGGALLTPLLMILTPYPAGVIIGTDIVTGAFTKLLGVFEHQKLDQVRWRLAMFLIAGALPGTLGGIFLIRVLKDHFIEAQLDHLLRVGLGVTLFGVGFLLPIARLGRSKLRNTLADMQTRQGQLRLASVGAVVGFLVALTSIGSGSLLMIFLLLLTPYRMGELVGTDILFGLASMSLAGAMHVWMGHFDSGLFLRLVVGGLPGVALGSRLTQRLPERHFNWVFSLLYLSLGARLLVG
jgi:uncharacterized membrane protein YfcA